MKKNNSNNINFLLGGTCTIAGIPFAMSLRSEEEGYFFGGRLLPGTILQIGEVIEKLSVKFNIPFVPEPIKSLNLKDLGFTYDSVDERFQFICSGSFSIDGSASVEMSVCITIDNNNDNNKRISFSGKIILSNLEFNLLFDTQNQGKNTFIATYHHTGDSSGISLCKLVSSISKEYGKMISDNLKVDLQEIKFVFNKSGEQPSHILFGLLLSAGIDLKNIPVVGDKLPDNVVLSIENLQLLFVSCDHSKEQIEELNKLFPQDVQPFPVEKLSKGIHISGKLHVLEHIFPINIGNKKEKENLKFYCDQFIGKTDSLTSNNSTLSGEIKWIEIKKKIGPVSFERIGIHFSVNTSTLSFAIDASLALGPVQLTMSELTVSSALSSFKPVFGLQGFFILLKTKEFELGGGFLRSESEGIVSYYGTVLAKAGTFSFTALGGHTPSHTDVETKKRIPGSFFIYAHIEIPLGGPVYFNIKGFAGGFGLNYKLNLPKIEDLHNFILLPAKAPKVKGLSPQKVVEVAMERMKGDISPAPGQYWISAGMHVRSFEMVDIFALATVSFGVDLVVSLIGTASMTLPKGAQKPVAYIEIVIKAAYSMSEGVLSIEGAISPATYLLGDFCKLKGGVAFYLWINPPENELGIQKGDFCLSMGGYHPEYIVPKHYPRPALVELKFNLDSLQVEGSGYFAVVPSMFMLGLRVKATYQVANIKAWFELAFNLIMAWSPLKYNAMATVQIGCIVQLKLFKISASASASVEIWGPEFGGKAHVNLSIIQFTIHFGEPQINLPQLLTWNEFTNNFLFNDVDKKNKEQTPFSISVSEGQIEADAENDNWTVDANYFNILVNSLIPANKLLRPNCDEDKVYKEYKSRDSINVKMLGKNKVQSTLTVILTDCNQNTDLMIDIMQQVGTAPGALWQEYKEEVSIKDPGFLENSINGVIVKPSQTTPSHVDSVPLYSLLFNKENKSTFHFEKMSTNPYYKVNYNVENTTLTINVSNEQELINQDYILGSMEEKKVKERRTQILENLKAIGLNIYSDNECILKKFTEETILADWPLVGLLGDNFKN